MDEREVAYQRYVWDNLRRNYAGTYLHGMLGMTGFRLVNNPIFIPAYLYAISGSDGIVGLGLALQQTGFIFFPIVGASLIAHRAQILPFALLAGGVGRVVLLALALAGWLLAGPLLVATTLLCLLVFGMSMGAQRVVFQTLMSKLIPLRRRGRLQAWRNATGGLVAAALGYLAGVHLIAGDVLGNGYATTFFVAFVLTSLGMVIFWRLVREPEPPTTRPWVPFRQRAREFPGLIRNDRRFGAFVASQLFAHGGRIAAPFYVIFVASSGDVSGATLGVLALAFLGADTLSNIVWGYLGDRKGFRLVLILSLAIWITATGLLAASAGFAAIVLAFVGLGSAQAGCQMSGQTMVLEFGSRDDTSMRIAVASTAEGVMASLGPLVGGLLAGAMGYLATFGASVACLATAIVIVLVAVPEPRTGRSSESP